MTCRAAPRRRSLFSHRGLRIGGRRGQAESDQELEREAVSNAFNQGTSPHGPFNSKTGKPQTDDEESLIRARDQASPCQNKGGPEKDRGARRGVSIKTSAGGRQTVC